MEFKRISSLSFFTNEQKDWFKNYIVYKNGDVFNEKTGKPVAKTLHGTRGYVVNLSIYINGVRKQRQIVLHRAIADLFIRPMKNGEKLFFINSDKTNIDISNLIYRLTKKQKREEYKKCLEEMKGITDEGRFCNSCGDFKKWEDISGGKKSSVCKACASKRGVEYQKSVKYSNRPVNFDTYFLPLKNDNPINIDEKLGFKCSKCNKVFLLTRSRVLNRVRSIKLKYKVRPLFCEKCIGEKNGI